MKFQRIALFGGTGFVGRQIISALTRLGVGTRVLTRRRERHRALLVNPMCEVVECDVHALPEISSRLNGCDAAINLVGILNENDRGDFDRVHADLPEKILKACQFNRIRRLVHMSALNAGPDAPSRYLVSKGEGEVRVHEGAGPDLLVTSLRPSVIFGPGDSFLNRFAGLLAMSPVLPLACPDSRFAPVFVGDVVEAFIRALDDPSTARERYALCGPGEYTLEELVKYTAELTGARTRVIGLGDGLSRLQASIAERLPGKPFSNDNYLSLKVDSICREGPGLADLGIEATALETMAPTYLGGRRREARNQRLRRLANRRG